MLVRWFCRTNHIAVRRSCMISADYVLFGNACEGDAERLDAIHRIDDKYLPLLDALTIELLALSQKEK